MKRRRPVALIVGMTGFIGSSLTHRLLRGGWKVHGLVRPGTNKQGLSVYRGQVKTHVYDGSIGSLERMVHSAKPDIVIHLASLFLKSHRPEDITPLMMSNVVLGAQLLEAMTACGVSRLINTGTYWQHYDGRDYSPVNLYAATKQSFVDILQYYVEARALRAITLELSDVYGPADPREKIFQALSPAVKTRKPLSMSPGHQKMNFVYIDDVLDAYVIAAKRLLGGKVGGHEVYAISGRDTLTLRDIVRIYEGELGRPVPVRWGGKPYPDRQIMKPRRSGARLPGWHCRVSLREGVRRMIMADAQARKPK